jgi:homoserine kinase
MNISEVTVSAPATIANLGPGYDLVGLALDRPRDRLRARLANAGGDKIVVSGVDSAAISTDPSRNVCLVAGRAVLEMARKSDLFMDMELLKHIPIKMGLGSSGASSVAGAYAVNQLLGCPIDDYEVLKCAMEGERAACGSPHADNVAPALFGGVTVITRYDPLEVVCLDPISKVEIVVVSPELELGEEKTKLARQVLPAEVGLKDVVKQMGAFASLILGIATDDPVLMGGGIAGDVIVEPARAKFISGFDRIKKSAMGSGAYGLSISGAGPSVFAVCPLKKGEAIGKAIKSVFAEEGAESKYAIYRCGEEGATIVS